MKSRYSKEGRLLTGYYERGEWITRKQHYQKMIDILYFIKKDNVKFTRRGVECEIIDVGSVCFKYGITIREIVEYYVGEIRRELNISEKEYYNKKDRLNHHLTLAVKEFGLKNNGGFV